MPDLRSNVPAAMARYTMSMPHAQRQRDLHPDDLIHVPDTGEVVSTADLRRFHDGEQAGLTVVDWDAAIQHGLDHETLHRVVDCTELCRYNGLPFNSAFEIGVNGSPCYLCRTTSDNERLCEKHLILLEHDDAVNPDFDTLPSVANPSASHQHIAVFRLGDPRCYACDKPMPGFGPGQREDH